jgi:murein DD-endopeptidase MepM/ murein hydrolase activator NlpD
MTYRQKFVFSIFLLFLVLAASAFRQNSDDIYPEYVIQSGDFLSVVSARFSTTLDEIIQVNQIQNPDAIAIGDRIKIPSLKGLSGTIITDNINIGETLSNISILSGMQTADIIRINQLTSYSEAFVGSTLILIENDQGPDYSAVDAYTDGATSLEMAVRHKINPVELEKINQINGAWDIAEKQVLFSISNNDAFTPVHSISPLIDQLEISKLPLMQGETQVIHIVSPLQLSLQGNILDQELKFYQDPENLSNWYAFFGVNAIQEVGLTDLHISGNDENGKDFDINQQIVVEPGIFTYEVVVGVDASTLEDHTNKVDDEALMGITQTSATRTWGEKMSYPVDEPCIVSGFGNRRTYNEGSYKNFHSGVDFGVCSAQNINIYAAADGTVLYSGELPIHGKHTIIDHGWGIYSTYSHQSEIYTAAGQQVKRGDLIGLIGSTGRSVGPHLHWEIKVNGVYVDPMSWIRNSYP